ncbi:MAG: alpha-glucosidase [Trueperaceae bacterium]|nr:alpha-glucosidase [Trueperaceae bacterium]
MVLALLVVASLAWWMWARWHPPGRAAGQITVDGAVRVPRTHAVGPFRLHTEETEETEAGFVLSVTHRAEPGRRLWASQSGRAFVAAADGDETVSMSRGHFTVRDDVQVRLSEQHLTRIEAGGETITLRGEVRSPNGQRRAPYRLQFTVAGPDRLRFELHVDDAEIDRSYLSYHSDPGERFFGFGMQFSHLDMKGRRLPIFIGEQGVGRGLQPLTLAADLTEGAGGSWHSSYAAVPHYLTSELRSLFLESSAYAAFDLRRDEAATIELFSGTMRGQIVYGDTPAALIRRYTAYAGRMPPLPDWVHQGAILGVQGGRERVDEVLGRARAYDVPLAAVWVQDWVGQRRTRFGDRLWWNWQVDRARYPGWEAWVRELRNDQGVRVLAYLGPMLADDAGQHVHDRDLFAEAEAADYLVRTPGGEVYRLDQGDFDAGLVDLTNPAAWAWLKGIVTETLLASGVSGWMADFGEGLPYDAVLHSGEEAAEVHARYAEMWAAFNREVIEDAGRLGDVVAFHRSGSTRSPRHATLFWLGDQLVSWDGHDGIETAVKGLLSSGFSGFSLNHGDTGGYTAITDGPFDYRRTPELLARWAELNAFTPVLRTHEGNRPGENHQVYDTADTLRHFASMAQLYAAWAGYRRELVREASETGLPVVRHPFLHYPHDPEVLDLTRQFMVGPDLMVAPVLDAGQEAVSLYLPKGRWVHLWSGEVHVGGDGDWVEVPAPLGQPAVFYREGAAVGASLRAAAARSTER